MIIHADEVATTGRPGSHGNKMPEGMRWTGKARVETFVVGHDVVNGERLQWIVGGGKYKASFLLPDEEGGSSSDGLLISETVVPGFEYEDHDFLTSKRCEALVTLKQKEEMKWMLRRDE